MVPSQRNIKIPQLRNLYERTGFDATQLLNTQGYGFLHDGSVDSLARFVGQPAFGVQSDQDIADLVAFMLAFSGSDLPTGTPFTLDEPPGTESFDTHAAVGQQVTLLGPSGAPGSDAAERHARLDALEAHASAGRISLIAKGVVQGEARGYVFDGNDYRSDRAAEVLPGAALRALASPSSALTFTAVVTETAERMGIDRDLDGALDRDEADAGTDPVDPNDRPIGLRYCAPAVVNSTGAPGRIDARGSTEVAGPSPRAARLVAAHRLIRLLPECTGPRIRAERGRKRRNAMPRWIDRPLQRTDPDQWIRRRRSPSRSTSARCRARPEQVPLQPGETWTFQAWHRDVGGATILTDAVEILFE